MYSSVVSNCVLPAFRPKGSCRKISEISTLSLRVYKVGFPGAHDALGRSSINSRECLHYHPFPHSLWVGRNHHRSSHYVAYPETLGSLTHLCDTIRDAVRSGSQKFSLPENLGAKSHCRESNWNRNSSARPPLN